MSAHTKGPWEVHDVNADCLLIRGDVPHTAEDRDYYRSLATVTQRNPHPRFGGGISHETCAANARLIAAAPELLTALLDCVLVFERDLNGLAFIQPELRNARAAIVKATGAAS